MVSLHTPACCSAYDSQSLHGPPCSANSPEGPIIVDTHSYMLSPFGPAEQLHGGSKLISASSFWIRLALEDNWPEPFMSPMLGPHFAPANPELTSNTYVFARLHRLREGRRSFVAAVIRLGMTKVNLAAITAESGRLLSARDGVTCVSCLNIEKVGRSASSSRSAYFHIRKPLKCITEQLTYCYWRPDRSSVALRSMRTRQ